MMRTRRTSLVFAVLLFGSALAEPAVFQVTSVAELEAALTTARTNGEGDTLVVHAGTYLVTSLSYQPAAGEDNFPLLIEGDGALVTVLDFGGSGNFSIATNSLADDTNRQVTLRGLTFQNGNGCEGGGLEVRVNAAGSTLERNVFRDNSSCDGNGGGASVRSVSGAITVAGNLFTGNFHDTTGYDGGGAFLQVETGVVTVTNNTLFGNATDGGRGDNLAVNLLEDTARAELFNNVVWGNGAEDIYVNDDGSGNGTGAPTNLFNNDYGSFTIVDGDQLAQGANLQQDPTLSLDFHLLVGSPAIDAGDNLAPALPALDLDGELRVMNATVDMGADEFPGQAAPAEEVPTLSEWGLALLLLVMAWIGVRELRHRRMLPS